MSRTIRFCSCILIMVSCFMLLCSCGKNAEDVLTRSTGVWTFENDGNDWFVFSKYGIFGLYLDNEFFRWGKYSIKENEILLLYEEYADEDCINWDNIDWDNTDRDYFVIMNYTFNNGELNIDGYRFRSYSDIQEARLADERMASLIEEYF